MSCIHSPQRDGGCWPGLCVYRSSQPANTETVYWLLLLPTAVTSCSRLTINMCGFRQKFGLVNSNHFWSIVAEFEWYMELYDGNLWPWIYSLWPYLQRMSLDNLSSSSLNPHWLSIVSQDVHSLQSSSVTMLIVKLKQLCLCVLCAVYTLS